MLIDIFLIGLFYPETNPSPQSPPVWCVHTSRSVTSTPKSLHRVRSASSSWSRFAVCGCPLSLVSVPMQVSPLTFFFSFLFLLGNIDWLLVGQVPPCSLGHSLATFISLCLSLTPQLTWALCEGRAQGWLIAQCDAELALRNMYGIESTHLFGIAHLYLCCRLSERLTLIYGH